MKPISLMQHLINTQPSNSALSTSLILLIMAITDASKAIAYAVRRSSLAGTQGEVGSVNVQDEAQKKLDVIANDIMIEHTPICGCLAGIASEENEDVILTDCQRPEYLLFMDPLDGSSNVDVNITVGTIFSIYRRKDPKKPVSKDEFLVSGDNQIAAGYIAYGSATQMALTLGNGVCFYTLSPETAMFMLTEENIRVPEDSHEFAVNMARKRFWHAPFLRYITELLAGETGPRGKDYNMRWVGSMVADVHRILCRGGTFMYPADNKVAGRLRLMYEANPMAMLIEQAGGMATNGSQAILKIQPTGIHQRVCVILGSRTEVSLVGQYLAEMA